MIISSITNNHSKSLSSKPYNPKPQKLSDILELTCHICASCYDPLQHVPITLCNQEHTYCSKCVGQLFNRRPQATRCPTCRAFITQGGTKVNKTLLRLCDLIPKAAYKFQRLQEDKMELECKVRNLESQLQKYEEKQNTNKQNVVQEVQKKDNFNGFPVILPKELNKKLNIHSFVSMRRRMTSARENTQGREIQFDQVGRRVKLI